MATQQITKQKPPLTFIVPTSSSLPSENFKGWDAFAQDVYIFEVSIKYGARQTLALDDADLGIPEAVREKLKVKSDRIKGNKRVTFSREKQLAKGRLEAIRDRIEKLTVVFELGRVIHIQDISEALQCFEELQTEAQSESENLAVLYPQEKQSFLDDIEDILNSRGISQADIDAALEVYEAQYPSPGELSDIRVEVRRFTKIPSHREYLEKRANYAQQLKQAELDKAEAVRIKAEAELFERGYLAQQQAIATGLTMAANTSWEKLASVLQRFGEIQGTPNGKQAPGLETAIKELKVVAKFNPQLDGLLEEIDALDRAFREGSEDAPGKLQEFHNHLRSLRVSHGTDGFEQVWKVLDGDRKLKEFLKKLEEIDPEALAPSEIQDIEAQQAQLISMFRGKCKALKKAMTQFNRDYQKATGRSIKVAQNETDTEASPVEAETPSSIETELENIITTAAVGDESVGF
jgi:hypothetical protein